MFSSPAIASLLQDLHTTSGLHISIHDTDFHELVSCPKNPSRFCALVQKNPKARARCLAADKEALEKVRDTGKIHLYKCRFGLWEAACPRYRDESLVEYLMMGQGKDSSCIAEQEILDAALRYTDSPEEMKACLAALPALSRETVTAFSNIMTLCAEHVAYLSAARVPSADLADSVKEYIDQNIEKKLTIPHLCAVFHCSKSTLINVFRKKEGITLGEYLTERRMEMAKGLLRHRDEPIGVVARRCGFADQGYFSKVFAAKTGCSPTVYRQRKKKD